MKASEVVENIVALGIAGFGLMLGCAPLAIPVLIVLCLLKYLLS